MLLASISTAFQFLFICVNVIQHEKLLLRESRNATSEKHSLAVFKFGH